MYFRDIKNKK